MIIWTGNCSWTCQECGKVWTDTLPDSDHKCKPEGDKTDVPNK